MTPGTIRVGISGWQYDNWRGDFYPAGLPRRSQLPYAAQRLPTIELNGPFYSLQRPTSYRRWRNETPESFVFAVKGGRYVTHLRQLHDVESALANFFASGVLELHAKLGPLLWQLPERTRFEPDLMARFLKVLPKSSGEAARLASQHDDKVRFPSVDDIGDDRPLRHALEVRNPTFGDERFFALLRKHHLACVYSDGAGRWPIFGQSTADFDYLRLHGHRELYASRYTTSLLRHVAERGRAASDEGRDVYVYFDNDAHGHAPHDALRLIEVLGIDSPVAGTDEG